MPNFYQIQEFLGVQQQKDGSALPEGSAHDARNCCTWDGNLSVAKGYVHHIASAVPGTERILKLIPLRGTQELFYVVTTGGVYVYKSSAWAKIHSFGTALSSDSQIGYVQTLVGSVACLLIATGQTRVLKVQLSDDSVSEFGSGAYSFESTVSAYGVDTATVTLNAALDSEAIRHITVDGVYISGKLYEKTDLTSYTGSSIVLASAPQTAPAVGDVVTVRGGGSDANCNFLGMYYGRLVSSGDSAAPCRLYWSAVPGDGRTVEDWLAVDGSSDASGGYVEIGNESNDPIVGMCVLPSQILVFKKLSVWRLYGDRPSTYAVECIEPFAESMSNASIVVKYSTPYYLTMTGLKTLGESGIGDALGGTRYLAEFLPLVKSVSGSRGVTADNRMYFSCKLDDDSAYDDTVLEFDFVTGAIMIRDGFLVADMTARDGRIFLVDGNRYVCRFNEGTSYAGAHIDAYWKTQPTDLQAKYYSKRVKQLHMRCSAGNMNVLFSLGDASRLVHKQTFGNDDGYVRIDLNADWSRVFSVEFRNVSGSQFCIKGGIDIEFEKELR